jgi:glutamine synthetase type III
MIAKMDRERYYRITEMKTRTSKSVFKVLRQTEVNYKIHEAGVFDALQKNLKKWSDLLAIGRREITGMMRYMPPGFFERLPKYYYGFSEGELRSFKPG